MTAIHTLPHERPDWQQQEKPRIRVPCRTAPMPPEQDWITKRFTEQK